MHARWQGSCLWAVVMLVLSGGCLAQSTGANTPDAEYKDLITVHQEIKPLGAHPFGEQVDLYSGALSFEVTDINAPGNGPALTLGRLLKTAEDATNTDGIQRPFGEWELDIPRIETNAGNQTNVSGWVVLTGQSPGYLDRCTQFRAPPPVNPLTKGNAWNPVQWWYGYHLIVPGHGDQLLLESVSGSSHSPTISGSSFPIVTKQDWMISCGVTASDGGEGFLAIAPDGTRYTFAHLVYRNMPYLQEPVTATGDAVGVHPMSNGSDNILARLDALMYVTQIQDRFGNTLTYNWDGDNLSSIVASDGRTLTLSYVPGTPLIQTATLSSSNAPARTWTYSYSGATSALPSLTGVQLPDGSAWSYQIGSLESATLSLMNGDCQKDGLPDLLSKPVTGSMTHPSGLTATFTITPVLHGRSYVPKACWVPDPSNPIPNYATVPNEYYQYSLTQEVLSGAGIPTETLTWSYSTPNQSWLSDSCASSNTCPSTVYTDVVDPDGHDVRYTFSNRYDATEGQLLRTDYYSAAAGTTLLRSEVNTYANPTAGPWPAEYGFDIQTRTNQAQATEASPLQQRVITQDGQNFTWQALAFDAYAQPTDVKRSNDIAGQTPIEETTAYLNDTNLWVLGLPQTVTNVGTGEVETSNTYNSLDELTARARFGETLMNYTWNSAGQLASFTDGNSHTTTLGNYYRGIPQTIDYPDGTSETLVVDDLGQITSIKDQSGHTTSYSYDPIGRIAQITYPYDSSIDSAQWYPKVFTYAYVTSAERGVAAGHWRRTTTQGNLTDTTYFDAELRPVLDDTSNGSTDISTATGYDWRGLTTLATYPAAGSPALSALTTGTHSTYDALGRLTQSQQDSELGTLTTTTAYLSGAREQVTDPKGNVTTTTYQVFDEPEDTTPIQVQAPTGITQTISRDVYGNPLSITQSGSYGTETDSVTKSLVYDSYHRLCRTVEPETGSTVLAYDGANNLLWSAEGQSISGTACSQSSVPAAAQTTRTYDAMNRVLTLVPPSGTQSTIYTYDTMGRVHTAVSGIATQGFAYNSLGDLTGESLQVAGSGLIWTIGYGYDAYGHRSTVTYPAGTGTSETVSYAPDAWGRATQAGNYATGVSYFPNGQVAGFTYGNGRSYLAQQNTRQLTSNFSDGAGSTLDLSEDFTYDADGNITAVNDLTGTGLRTKSFGYDALNRLTSATASNLYGTESYTYDPINNLRTRLTDGQTLTYNYDATNKLTSITQGATSIDNFIYNPQGDTIDQNSVALNFDAKHQLTGFPSLESYSYDAAGRRVEKSPISGPPTYYFYNQAGQLMYQYDFGTAAATNFIYLGTRLIAQHAFEASQVVGNVDSVTADGSGNTIISGWACSTNIAQSIDVDVYFGGPSGGGGTDIGRYLANQTSEPAVASVCNVGSGSYRFSISIPASTRYQYAGKPVYVYGISPVGNSNSALNGSGSYDVPVINSQINGNIDGVINDSSGNAMLSGWACSTNIAQSINVDLYIGAPAGTGVYIGRYLANQSSEAAVASACDVSSGSYRFLIPLSAAVRSQYAGESIYLYGISPVGNPNLAIPGSGTITVPANVAAPSAPIAVTATVASNLGSITVSWTGSTAATSYNVQHLVNGGAWSASTATTTSPWILNSPADGSYEFQVQACNVSGCSAWVTSATISLLHVTAAPTLSTPAISSTGGYTVSWTSVSAATSYTVQQQVNGGGWTTILSNASTSWAASGEGNGTYAYRVQGCNGGGCGPWSATGTTTVTLVPASAPSLTVPASSATGSYTVSWGAVSMATSYTLQLSIDSGGWSTVQSSSATSWGASGQATGTYGYRVQACSASGCGPWSSTGTINVLLPPNSAPSLIVPGSSSTGSYTVSWGSVATASSYTLQENANSAGWSTAQSSSGTSWSTSGRGTGSYAYRVEACNASGCGPWSGTGTISVLLPPPAPSSISVPSTVVYPASVAISWAAASTATSYNLQRTDITTSTLQGTIYSGSATSYSDSVDLAKGQYQYAVEACNAAGCSGWTQSGTLTYINPGPCPAVATAVATGAVNPLSIKCPPPAVSTAVKAGKP